MGYHVRTQLPDLSDFKHGFLAVNTIFAGLGPSDFTTRALMSAYLRLAGTACQQYEAGRQLIEWLWRESHGSIPLGAIQAACGFFEACITNMHRATGVMIALKRQKNVQQDVKDILPERVRFTQEPVAARLRTMRNAVHHFEGLILKGKPPDNKPIALTADGLVTTSGKDAVKVIDRLKIGDQEILFDELCQWLREMAECAKALQSYRPASPTAPSEN
jgi:hypothetical protein